MNIKRTRTEIINQTNMFFLKSIICTGVIFLFSLLLSGSRSALAYDITPKSIRIHHQALVDISAKAGGLNSGIRLNEAGKKAAEYLLAEYKKAGLKNVRFEEFYPNRWWPENYSLEIIGDSGNPDEKLLAFPLWDCKGAKNLELEVVYAGYGTSGEFRGLDVKGKALLIDMKRLLHFIASYNVTKALDRAKKKGALAVIITETRVESPSGNSAGNSGKIKNQKAGKPELFPMPVFSIGKSDGEKLKAQLKKGTTMVRVNLEYSLKPWKAVNIIGELPGSGKIDEYIIVGGHYDSWFDGAIDNLGSQASLLEMAKHFAEIPRSGRNRNLIFASIFGHEFRNSAMGHAAFVEKRADIQEKVTCFLDVDGSGSWGWEEKGDTGEVLPTKMDDKSGIFASSYALASLAFKPVYRHARGPWMLLPINFFVADIHGPIAEAGYPSILAISKHIYYHSMLDTIDRITPDQVYRRTLINIGIINNLQDSPAGYLINVDTNPHRRLKEGEKPESDLTPDKLPVNLKPWVDGPPAELGLHVIPPNPRVFSPVIVWPAFFKIDSILMSDNVSLGFGGVLGLLGPKKTLYGGTIYFFPGTKTVTYSVTDSKGRTTTISRKIKVTTDYYFIYWFVLFVLCALIVFIILRVKRRRARRA